MNMKKRDLLCIVAIGVILGTVAHVYGKWPRVAGQLVSHKTFREAVANIDTNPVTYLYTAEPTMSETYQFGPEDHPGFSDSPPDIDEELVKALHAMVIVESGGDPNAVGDLHLTNKAYGALQIRKPYLDDVNGICSDGVVRVWGRLLTLADMKDPDRAWWVAEKYLEHYGNRYYRVTGKRPDVRVYAALHNGGPNGWKRLSTNEYVEDVVSLTRR